MKENYEKDDNNQKNNNIEKDIIKKVKFEANFIRKSKKEMTIMPKQKHDRKSITFLRQYSLDQKNKSYIDSSIDFKLHKEYINRVIEIFKRGPRQFKEKQLFISYLNKLEPFNQILTESKKEEVENILIILSNNLRYERIIKDKILLKYGDNLEKFYLIFQGKVDILIPNEEEISLTEEEYYYYLIRLRIFNELSLINTVISKNYITFHMEEKNFDEWIKTAFNTIKFLKGDIKIKSAISSKTGKGYYDDDLLKKKFLLNNIEDINPSKSLSKSPNPRKKFKKNKILFKIEPKETVKKIIFDTIEKKNFVLKYEKEILIAMKLIDPNNFELLNLDITQYLSKSISSQQYINRIKPIKFNPLDTFRKNAKVFSYIIVNSYHTGDKFGDIMNDSQKNDLIYFNGCTMITSKNSDFGTLNKEEYKICLKDISEKVRKKKLKFLLNLEIFKNFNQNVFTKKFSSYFKKRMISNREILFNEGDEPLENRTIYFINSGEFISYCNKNIYEINDMFINLGFNFLINESDEDEVLDKESDDYIKFKKKKILIKLLYLKGNDIIGLNNSLYNNKYIYSIQCCSPVATVYEIKYNMLKILFNSDDKLIENIKNYENIKKNLIMKILLKMREKKTENFKIMEKVGCDLSFGPIKFKKYNNSNVLQNLLEKRKQYQMGDIPRTSKHKKKFLETENNIKKNFNENTLFKNKLKKNVYEKTLYNNNIKDLNLNNLYSFSISEIKSKRYKNSINFTSKPFKKSILNQNYLENNTINTNDNLPLINNMTLSTDKDKSNVSFIFDKKNFNSINVNNNSKSPNKKKYKILISKRRDNTILIKKDQTKDYINNQNKITNSIKGLFNDKFNKKESVFNLLSKKIYKEKLIKI